MKKARAYRPRPLMEVLAEEPAKEPSADPVLVILADIAASLDKIEKHLKPSNAKIDAAGGKPNV